MRCESCRWLIFESFYTISDIIFCVAINFATVFSFQHFVTLKCTFMAVEKEEMSFKNFKSFCPQLLNMLLWNYNPEQLNSHTKNDTISLILICFFLQGADKFFTFGECGQFILLFRLSPAEILLDCSQNPLIIDPNPSHILCTVFSFFHSIFSDPSSAFCLIND